MSKLVIIYTTIGSKEEAQKISKDLVTQKLIACANAFPAESAYIWKGALESHGEYGIILIAIPEKKELACKELRRLHPYEVPCILTYEVGAENPYLDWALQTCRD